MTGKTHHRLGNLLDESRLFALDSNVGREKMSFLLDVFFQAVDAQIARLLELAQVGGNSEVGDAALSLAGTAGNYGAARLERVARERLCASQGRQPAELQGTLADLFSAHAATVTALQLRYPSADKFFRLV